LWLALARFGTFTAMRSVLGTRLGIVLICAIGAISFTACKKGGKRGKSEMAQWVDNPTPGTKSGNVIRIAPLDVKFEVPDTLYVYRNCGEAGHSPDGAERWIPVVTCTSGGATWSGFDGEGGDDEAEEDPFAEEDAADAAEADGSEQISITFYVTHKTRPLDERAVSWFENQYKQAGLEVQELSFQHDFQKKSGIYARLHVMDASTGNPTREIVQFLFPRNDVVFIARMEYPFGETRSVDTDWKYILWNFDFEEASPEK
jgi:hypothetical protein